MNLPRRLLMIAERFPPDLGGVARSSSRTAGALAGLGVEVHVLAWTKTLEPGAMESVEQAHPSGGSVVVHRLGLFSNWDFSMQHTLNVLEWLHGRERLDAVWGHYIYPAGYLGVLFAESVGIPSTVSARGNDIDRLMFPPGDFARLLWTLERATLITAVSQDLANKIDVLLGKHAGAMVVPNVVDVDTFSPQAANPALRESLGIQPEEAVLGFCGELRHKKGLPFLLTALREVQQVRPACLLVIGEVRPREQTHLSTFAADNPTAASRILVTGQLDQGHQVAAHLQLCDVFLQPSVWDGLPNALLEAMACKRVAIASDAGGIPEALEHGQNGFLIPKALLHNLGTAILEVLTLSAEQRNTIGKAARNTIVTKYHSGAESAVLGKVLGRLTPRTSS